MYGRFKKLFYMSSIYFLIKLIKLKIRLRNVERFIPRIGLPE